MRQIITNYKFSPQIFRQIRHFHLPTPSPVLTLTGPKLIPAWKRKELIKGKKSVKKIFLTLKLARLASSSASRTSTGVSS